MADLRPTLKERIAAVVPYVAPVLGGFLGMVVVNMNRFLFINPVLAVGLGIVIGWFAGRGLVRVLERMH